ncbi:maleylpyruvate isomerase family mycothiol-dependent enzyme [Actinomadura sp. WMMB 499]|uniref:maleylpyruvate isomerase family mycothiol-dependent enzyme n=1 Tax=Actinomadura sp. WMMB 499 TaxID=1219491 RepID=UPI00124750F6|nr:maleylpyruvate isomerase family mycothiol-dependent enzyme [Actinomadura sp. WMMB 499]QFG24287.1 maleylpyruvate isomerase family mycothiol-dependent enzyme [Actinomadura sp. WMMB 499]
MDVFDDLAAEFDQLDEILTGLDAPAWDRPSACEGWSIADVVLHLAQTNELVLASAAGHDSVFDREPGVALDDVVDRLVAEDRGTAPEDLLARWRTSAHGSLDALRTRDPKAKLLWAAAPLSPRTLATTRIAEHWAHALDITGPLGTAYPDTSRLRHVAWLAHRTLPYALAAAGEQAGPVRCELTGPDGDHWEYGDPEAASVIRGPAAEFCRVGARRLPAERSTLAAQGPDAALALRHLRNYAV